MTASVSQAVADDKVVPAAAICAARAAAEKLGTGTVVMAMGDLLGVTDAFVLTSGRNTRQVRTLVEEIERQVKLATKRVPQNVEGLRDLQWVLMDYGDFIVHVFHEDTRSHYDLERLWGDAPRVSWQTDATHRDTADRRGN